MTQIFLWLGLGAFLLGACPFSMWVGFLWLQKDIRRYGDGNPGAVNVFRAGNPAAGLVAVALDVGKGIPLVWLSWHRYRLGLSPTLCIAFAAILGHAFSPILRFHGGKAVAVTFGALIGLGRANMLLPFALTALAGYTVLDSDAWAVMLAPLTTLAFLVVTGAGGEPISFLVAVAVLFYAKFAADLKRGLSLRPGLAAWLQGFFQA